MVQERMVYINGDIVPESKAKISIFDYVIKAGYMVQEYMRTFNHKPFKLKQHLDRLYMSLKTTGINAGMTIQEMENITLDVLSANISTVEDDNDLWIIHEISPGIHPTFIKLGVNIEGNAQKPTILILCVPLPYPSPADYENGVHIVVPSTRQMPPECCDPKIKHNSRLYMVLAEREARLVDPEAHALMLDLYGNVTENPAANFFIVKNGVVYTSSRRNVLQGITRETVLELALNLKIPAVERDFQVYDVYNADEAFLTKTSACILPCTKINKVPIGDGKPGPVTKRLLKAFSELVGLDIVQQAAKYYYKRQQN